MIQKEMSNYIPITWIKEQLDIWYSPGDKENENSFYYNVYALCCNWLNEPEKEKYYEKNKS